VCPEESEKFTMPVHDWTKVEAGIFHDFRLSWVVRISQALNSGVLPASHYSLLDRPPATRAPLSDELDSVDDRSFDRLERLGKSAFSIRERPPRVRFDEPVDVETYARIADRSAVFQQENDRVVAYIDIVSPGTKGSPMERDRFFQRLDEALEHCCHLLVIDVLPPGPHDPRGMHAAFWECSHGSSHGCTSEEPIGVAAYRVEIDSERLLIPHAYFEPLKSGAPLPDMPLFLSETDYVEVPLEQTYQEAWNRVPNRWKPVIETEPIR
jgi:hypothetical protein